MKQLKEKLASEIDGLSQTKTSLSNEVKSLEEKKEKILTFNEETAKKTIENTLTKLKNEKPELFYISGEEQIAKLVGYFLKWLFS